MDARDVAAAMPAAMDAAFGPSAPSPGCTRIDSGAPGWPDSVSRAVTVSRSQARLGAWFGAWFGIWLRALVLNVTNRRSSDASSTKSCGFTWNSATDTSAAASGAGE